MKKIFIIIATNLLILLNGCSSSNYFIKPGININGFKYVVIHATSYDPYNSEIILTDLFYKKGLQVISKDQAINLTSAQRGQFLLAVIDYARGGSKAEFSFRLFDIKQELIYQGRGSYDGLNFSDYEDMKGAVENAFANFDKLYTAFDPKYSINPVNEFKEKFKDWEKIDLTESELKAKLSSLDLDPIEGIWSSIENNDYRIGIIRDSNNDKRDFVAFILETNNSLWEEKQVKIEFRTTAYQSVYSATYYMSDHSKQGSTAFINNNGILEIKLKNPDDNSEVNSNFIKNHPSDNKKSFVDITKENSKTSGTGFLISESGLVATNWHVIENNNTTEVHFPQLDKVFSATLVIKDSKNDIAILKLINFSYNKIFNSPIPYPIASSNYVKQGNKVFTLGFPLGNLLGQTSKLSDGIINSLYGIQDDPRLMQISNPIQPGNSGGPLFNSEGEIVGIVVATLNAKYFYENADIIPQNVNFAVKSDYILNLSSMLPEDKEVSKRLNKLKGLSLDKQVERISPFILSVKSK